MKIISYRILQKNNYTTDHDSDALQSFVDKQIKCTSEMLEANEEIAKREAYNGEYTIEDDGNPEPEVKPTSEERIAELESMLNALLGVTE